MKKSAIVLAAGSLLAGSAFAQTSVTLYGIADVSLRYTNHADAAGHGLTELTDGAITQSRWGLKGAEDLGNGLKAIFQLENGYSLDTGKMNGASTGQLFNRQAYVGLSGNFGAIKLGRQNSEAFAFFGDYDPLTVGNYFQNSWMYGTLARLRNNNVVNYSGKFGGLDVGASYAFGETPGSFTKASGAPTSNGSSVPYWGVHAAYEYGPFGFGGVFQESRDQVGNKQQFWGVGGKYTVQAFKLFLGYQGGKDRTGAADINLNQSISSPAATAIIAGAANNPRKDNIAYAGTTWQASPALAVTGAFYYDWAQNVNGTTASGKRYTGALIAEYSLSKRTQVYGAADYNHVSGQSITELPSSNNQFGVAAGIRHIF
ncbi:porin [Cupriavidus sp. WKF15]|uniref:porin n=1 Tax=Cupriavidus sp. WKF15 TaxID=3032282 RepID=UPI0023E2CF2E|nr:porin [Cupriavidus sp. WKF15]WER46089.1 porin [Cupriavidus sp. WKF15]